MMYMQSIKQANYLESLNLNKYDNFVCVAFVCTCVCMWVRQEHQPGNVSDVWVIVNLTIL